MEVSAAARSALHMRAVLEGTLQAIQKLRDYNLPFTVGLNYGAKKMKMSKESFP